MAARSAAAAACDAVRGALGDRLRSVVSRLRSCHRSISAACSSPGVLAANASAYGGAGGGVQVGCFVRRSAWRGVDEDGEEVVFAGTLAPSCLAGAGGVQRLGHGALEEEVAAMRVDRLAEDVWNSYFGGWSRWHNVDAA